MSMPISSNVDEENKRIILTTLVAGESGWGMYKITKKARYKVILPPEERDTPVWAPNATAVSMCLQEYGRSFSTQDVYNYFSSTRCLANKSEARLKGAQLIKL